MSGLGLCLSSQSPDVHLDMVLVERLQCYAFSEVVRSEPGSALALDALPMIVMPELDHSV